MVFASLLLLMIVSYLLVPRLVQSLGAKAGSEALGRELSIGRVEFAPWRLGLSLQDVRVAGLPKQHDPLLTLDRLDVDLSLSSLWHLSPVVDALAIQKPVLRLTRTAEGHYDIDDLIAKFSAPVPAKAKSEPLAVALYNIQLQDGQILLDDQPLQRRHELSQLRLALPFVSTASADVKVWVQPVLAGVLNGVHFGSQGEALPFAAQPEAKLNFKLDELDLAPYLGYLPAALPLRLVKGKVQAELALQFQQPPKQKPQLTLSGQIKLADFALQKPDQTPWLAWNSLGLGLKQVQPLQQHIALAELNWQGLDLQLDRDAAGHIWLPSGTAPPAANASVSASAKPVPSKNAVAASPWQFSLDQFKLSDSKLSWRDAGVPGRVALNLTQLELSLGAIQWPLKSASPLAFSAQLQPEAGKAAAASQLKGEAQISPSELTAGLAWEQLPLQWFEPYWAAQTPLRFTAHASGRASIKLTQPLDENPLARLSLGLQDLQVSKLSATAQGAKSAEALFKLDALKLDKAELDLGGQAIKAGELSLSKPDLLLARAKGADWNFAALLPAAAPAGAAKKAPAPKAGRRPVLKLSAPEDEGEPKVPVAPRSKDWRLSLQSLKVDGGQLRLQDAAAPAGVASLKADQLRLRLDDVAWPGSKAGSAAQLNFRMGGVQAAQQEGRRAGRRGQTQIAAAAVPAGSFDWRGRIVLEPLSASGKLRAERLPLHLLAPYLDPALGFSLQRAELGLRGEFNGKQQGSDWLAGAKADVLLTDLRLQQTRLQDGQRVLGEELLNWQALNLDGVRFEMKPKQTPQLAIAELRLSDFFARLLIDEQGHFNLSSLGAEKEAKAAEAPVAAPPAAPAASVAVAAPAPLPLQISLEQTRISKGRVDFTDHFVRPNYSAQLSELEGSLGAVKSGQAGLAPLQLRGKVAGTGLLEIEGQLNPLGSPLQLDVRASATDIELAPLSPYAAKYAGYAIERGKLSTKVQYKIEPGGALQANNQVILNQLTFGEAVASPDATKLPVLLAVALMKDRNGVIDVDLPVSGSINDPQFSVGAVVWKLVLNLIGKALTSPFSLLSGGGGDDHSRIAFAPGSATPSSPQVLDKVAKALLDKPSLNLTIIGSADLEQERDAIQQAQLERAMLAQRRLELQRRQTASGDAQAAAADLSLSEADRARLLKSVYEATKLPNKPRNVLGFAKDLPASEMRSLLLVSFPIDEDRVRALALARGVAVRDALIAKGLPNSRIFLASPKLHHSEASGKGEGWTPTVELKLATD
ncbi:hypothetical protein DBR47_20610 [Paucibacter sp. KBW04]|nr:hypothetical protein DBR47_20610 [Paucibacter sp. KBW04]